MTFRVGQKVVRIGSTGRTFELAWLKEFRFTYPEVGEVVTVKTINDWSSGAILTFCEHDNSHLAGVACKMEPGFAAKHFRPIVSRETSIEIFTKILTGNRKRVSA